jgi:hypothetical protein
MVVFEPESCQQQSRSSLCGSSGVPAAGGVQWLVVIAGERGEVKVDRS